MNSPTPSGRRNRGRPPGSRSVLRQRLLQAARDTLADPAAGEITLLRLARRAGVTPALAHYYFTDRAGLLRALIDERVLPHVEDLVSAARVRMHQPVVALTFLMQRTTSMLAADPLLRRCLWLPDAPARALRQKLREVVRSLLQAAQQGGLLRADLGVDYLTDALLGLALHPFLDARGPEDATPERVAALTLAHVALLQDGIVRAQRPRQESSA